MTTITLVALSCSPAPEPQVADLTKATSGADDRFGVILSDTNYYEQTLELLGVRWYQDYSYDTRGIPKGTTKVLKVRSNRAPIADELQASARSRPGSYWMIGNEPNEPGQDDVSPEDYAAVFHQYVSIIKGADPTARIVGPEILNFDTTCTGCAGFPSGHSWLDSFRRSYRSAFNTEPPIDIWSIHTYNLDWERLPQVDYQAQIREIQAFRAYLDAVPALKSVPIWLTEFSVLWGYDGIRWNDQNGTMIASPEGTLREDKLSAYLNQMVGWLQTHAKELNLQRWFLFSSHAYKEPWATAPGGVALVHAGEDHLPKIAPLGTQYGRLAHGQQP